MVVSAVQTRSDPIDMLFTLRADYTPSKDQFPANSVNSV
jgi:hypothetical protein